MKTLNWFMGILQLRAGLHNHHHARSVSSILLHLRRRRLILWAHHRSSSRSEILVRNWNELSNRPPLLVDGVVTKRRHSMCGKHSH